VPEIDPLTRRSIALFLASARRRYPIVEAWLYGSRARGDAREDSDVDLALVIDGEMGLASSVAADLGSETYDVLNETGQYVSPLPIRLTHWRDPAQHSNPFLLANIRREGVAL
jgi:antitoxin ChpS